MKVNISIKPVKNFRWAVVNLSNGRVLKRALTREEARNYRRNYTPNWSSRYKIVDTRTMTIVR